MQTAHTKATKKWYVVNGWEKLVNDDSLNLFVPQRHKQHDSWTFKYFYLLIQLRLLLLILIYIGIDDAMRFEYVHVQCSHSHTQKKEKTKKKQQQHCLYGAYKRVPVVQRQNETNKKIYISLLPTRISLHSTISESIKMTIIKYFPICVYICYVLLFEIFFIVASYRWTLCF